MSTTFVLAPYSPDAKNYVVSTWLKTFAEVALHHEYQGKPLAQYYAEYNDRINAVLPRCAITLIADEDYPDVIAAWVAVEGNTLHYAYTRADVRNQGAIKTALILYPNIKWTSHKTVDWMKKNKYKLIYMPSHFSVPPFDGDQSLLIGLKDETQMLTPAASQPAREVYVPSGYEAEAADDA